jgi:GNAT superfamily N-acetyltransferase
LTGLFNFVSHWQFSRTAARKTVAALAKHFRDLNQDLIWHVYGHDGPDNLSTSLRLAGFIPEQTVSLKVIETEAACRAAPHRPELDVRRVATPRGLRDYLWAGTLAFGAEDSWQDTAFRPRLTDPDLALYVVQADNAPVAAARLALDSHSGFGELFGGGVAPAHRGKGYYRALVGTHAALARSSGVENLVTSARDTSQPILERLGFRTLQTKTCWRLPLRT